VPRRVASSFAPRVVRSTAPATVPTRVAGGLPAFLLLRPQAPVPGSGAGLGSAAAGGAQVPPAPAAPAAAVVVLAPLFLQLVAPAAVRPRTHVQPLELERPD
jgi:hypothetical protein